MSRFCSNCGKELQENAKFCDNCGAPAEVNGGGIGADKTLSLNTNDKTFENQTLGNGIQSEIGNKSSCEKKPKKKKGCGCLIIIAVVVCFLFICYLVGSSDYDDSDYTSRYTPSSGQSQSSQQSKEYKSQEDIVAEAVGVDLETAGNIVSILNSCEVRTITSVKRDELLDNAHKDGEKGYRIDGTEVTNAILYLNADNTVNMVRWKDSDLYADGAQVDTVSKVRNRPDLEILNYSSESDGYLRYVVGEIRNNTKATYSYVQVEIGLYHGDTLVGSTLDNVNNLEPGATWRFKALIYDDNADHYKITDVSGF